MRKKSNDIKTIKEFWNAVKESFRNTETLLAYVLITCGFVISFPLKEMEKICQATRDYCAPLYDDALFLFATNPVAATTFALLYFAGIIMIRRQKKQGKAVRPAYMKLLFGMAMIPVILILYFYYFVMTI